MIEAYFALSPEKHTGFQAELSEILDPVPNFAHLATLADGRKILHARLGAHQVAAIEVAGTPVELLTGYIGEDRDSVLTAFPELAGTHTVEVEIDEQTFTQEESNFPEHRWF